MAKELPYFRFTAFEWLNDDISLESYELKGLFIDVCAYYWFKDCSITTAILAKRFINETKLLNKLLQINVIKVDKNRNIDILFLNEQYDILSNKRKQRQIAGKKGGKQKSSNAKAKAKQNPSYKDKYNNKDKDNTEFNVFWNLYDKKTGKDKCITKWYKLTTEEKAEILSKLPDYLLNIKDKKYQKDPLTWLNGKHWEDELRFHKTMGIPKDVAYIALSIPSEMEKLKKQGYSLEEIKQYAS